MARIALTFDDGPNGECTDAILDAFAQHRGHGTFFVIGEHVAREPERVQRAHAAGHAIGNHTWDHPSLPELDDAAITDQLERTSALIAQTIGMRPSLFRSPYGNRDARTDAVVRSCGLVDHLWDVHTYDYELPGTHAIVDAVLEADLDRADGVVVLLHDGPGDRWQTVGAVEHLIPELLARGHELVRLDAR